MRVILGITGGIAAYKATGIIRLLTEAGHDVKVIPTQNALRFIGATTLEALSHNSVDPDLYTDVESVKHVELGQNADLVIVAPASASFLARYASGIADDLLGNTLLATKATVIVAPAMHSEMWLHPATQQNVATLKSRGVVVIEPASGRLTGSDSGVGRLPEPNEIVAAALAATTAQDLLGQRVLVAAGGTREPIDAVRFIGNSSSGKQGIAIAERARARGATVKLIAANVDLPISSAIEVIRVQTAAEMSAAVQENIDSVELLVMAAAVADYSPTRVFDQKLKKSELGETLELRLRRNVDILTSVVAARESLVVCGFAAETADSPNELEKLGRGKLIAKKLDVLVANDVSQGRVFGEDSNSALILTAQATKQATGSKQLVANEILDVCSDILAENKKD